MNAEEARRLAEAFDVDLDAPFEPWRLHLEAKRIFESIADRLEAERLEREAND